MPMSIAERFRRMQALHDESDRRWNWIGLNELRALLVVTLRCSLERAEQYIRDALVAGLYAKWADGSVAPRGKEAVLWATVEIDFKRDQARNFSIIHAANPVGEGKGEGLWTGALNPLVSSLLLEEDRKLFGIALLFRARAGSLRRLALHGEQVHVNTEEFVGVGKAETRCGDRAPVAALHRELRVRGPNGARDEFHLAATAQNLRKLAKLIPAPPPILAT